MKTIPRYWAFAPTKTGILVWRSSPESEAAARESARQAAERVSRFEQGEELIPPKEYPYGVTLREKLLGEIDDARGQLHGFVTRNHTGAEVLNIKNVMFLDWDTPYESASSLGALFKLLWNGIKRFFGVKTSPVVEAPKMETSVSLNPGTGAGMGNNTTVYLHPDNVWENRVSEKWEQDYTWAAVPELAAFMSAVTQWPDWGVRVYKTFAGYRGLVTHTMFDPSADTTLDLMRQFRCDPQYVALCKRQESFRARLTPKGWRCKFWGKLLPSSFKFYFPRCNMEWNSKTSDEAAEIQRVQATLAEYESIYDEAVAAYEQAAAGYATCRYLGTVGNDAIHPDIVSIVALHDEMTHALSETEMTLA
jgi:hypothetical protein